jgi:hypothetical protein
MGTSRHGKTLLAGWGERVLANARAVDEQLSGHSIRTGKRISLENEPSGRRTRVFEPACSDSKQDARTEQRDPPLH